MQIHLTYSALCSGRALDTLPLGVREKGKQSISLLATLEIGL